MSKHDKLEYKLNLEIKDFRKKLENLDENDKENLQKITQKIIKLEKDNSRLKDLKKEIARIKKGSVALVGQITTISKIRIYDPVYSHNVLYGIRLQPTTLSEINEKIKELYIYQKKTT